MDDRNLKRAGPALSKPKPRIFEQVCDRIRAELAAGTIKPGDRLPAERDLAQQLGVSRSAVREALRSLEMSGILSLEKGASGGAYVREASADGLARSLHDLLFLSNVPLEQLTEVRSALLSLATRKACARATLSDLVDLETNIADTLSAWERGKINEAIIHIGAFYELLGKAAHNEVLVVMIASLTATVRALLEQTQLVLMPEFVAARRGIVQSIREADPDGAEQKLRRHLAALERYVSSHPRASVLQEKSLIAR